MASMINLMFGWMPPILRVISASVVSFVIFIVSVRIFIAVFDTVSTIVGNIIGLVRKLLSGGIL